MVETKEEYDQFKSQLGNRDTEIKKFFKEVYHKEYKERKENVQDIIRDYKEWGETRREQYIQGSFKNEWKYMTKNESANQYIFPYNEDFTLEERVLLWEYIINTIKRDKLNTNTTPAISSKSLNQITREFLRKEYKIDHTQTNFYSGVPSAQWSCLVDKYGSPDLKLFVSYPNQDSMIDWINQEVLDKELNVMNIIGDQGTGKSTLARVLALECFERFLVFWFQQFKRRSDSSNSKFFLSDIFRNHHEGHIIIIIDDWDLIDQGFQEEIAETLIDKMEVGKFSIKLITTSKAYSKDIIKKPRVRLKILDLKKESDHNFSHNLQWSIIRNCNVPAKKAIVKEALYKFSPIQMAHILLDKEDTSYNSLDKLIDKRLSVLHQDEALQCLYNTIGFAAFCWDSLRMNLNLDQFLFILKKYGASDDVFSNISSELKTNRTKQGSYALDFFYTKEDGEKDLVYFNDEVVIRSILKLYSLSIYSYSVEEYRDMLLQLENENSELSTKDFLQRLEGTIVNSIKYRELWFSLIQDQIDKGHVEQFYLDLLLKRKYHKQEDYVDRVWVIIRSFMQSAEIDNSFLVKFVKPLLQSTPKPNKLTRIEELRQSLPKGKEYSFLELEYFKNLQYKENKHLFVHEALNSQHPEIRIFCLKKSKNFILTTDIESYKTLLQKAAILELRNAEGQYKEEGMNETVQLQYLHVVFDGKDSLTDQKLFLLVQNTNNAKCSDIQAFAIKHISKSEIEQIAEWVWRQFCDDTIKISERIQAKVVEQVLYRCESFLYKKFKKQFHDFIIKDTYLSINTQNSKGFKLCCLKLAWSDLIQNDLFVQRVSEIAEKYDDGAIPSFVMEQLDKSHPEECEDLAFYFVKKWVESDFGYKGDIAEQSVFTALRYLRLNSARVDTSYIKKAITNLLKHRWNQLNRSKNRRNTIIETVGDKIVLRKEYSHFQEYLLEF